MNCIMFVTNFKNFKVKAFLLQSKDLDILEKNARQATRKWLL